MSQAAPTKTLPEKVVEQIQISSHTIEKLAAVNDAREKRAAEATALIPQVVEALVAGGRLTDTPDRRTKMAEALQRQDPVELMQILIKTAKHRNADEMARLGQASGTEKTASAKTGSNSPFVGVPTSEEKESDRAFKRGLGLAT